MPGVTWGGVNTMGEAHNWAPAVGDDQSVDGSVKFTARTSALEAAKKGKLCKAFEERDDKNN